REASAPRPAPPPREVPAPAGAIETRRPVIIEDAVASDLVPPEWSRTFGLRSTMVVPLIRQDEIIGVMSLDYCERLGAYAPWQVKLAVAIAGQLVLSLEN